MIEATPSRGRRSESNKRRQRHQKHKCHEVTTPKPTTTTPIPTTTTLAPNTSVCSHIYRINTSSGAYLKTICHVKESFNTAQALNYCQNNAMTLMKMTDYDTFSQYQVFIAEAYGVNSHSSFILNGYRNTTGNWFLYSDPSTPVYNGLVWDTDSVANIPLPQCSLFTQFPGGYFVAIAYDCAQISHFNCEFI